LYKLCRLGHKHPFGCSQAAQGALLASGGYLYQLGRRAYRTGKVFEKMVGCVDKGLSIKPQARQDGRVGGWNETALARRLSDLKIL